MTPPILSETQNLGHTGIPQSTPNPVKRSGGCGGCGCGCFSGCLSILLLIVGVFVAIYFSVFQDSRYIGHLDTVVVWTYKNQVRPKIIESFGANMNHEQREQLLQSTDAALDKYLTLPPEEKKVILTEGSTALYYLWTAQILPPEKIPHLKKFIDEFEKPAPSQRYDSPEPRRPSPRRTPRLSN